MKEAGFTLIEVLAALLIFSLAIIGLSHAGTESARAVTALDEKMLAGIVADNQLVLARARPLEVGTQQGQETAMSRPFEYDLVTRQTDTPNFYQIIVKVRREDGEQILIERTAFRGGPL